MENQDIKLNLLKAISGNGNDLQDIKYSKDHFLDIVERQYTPSEVIEKLINVKEDKIKVREILIESEIDFVKSCKQLKTVYELEFKNMIQKLNDLYNKELLELKQLYRKAVVGEQLVTMVNAVSSEGWVLVMKESSVNLYKCYNPTYHVTEGIYENGEIHIYESPVTQLRGIYVNILHPKITSGTIHLSTDGGQHPNCDSNSFGIACPGTLDEREIPVNDNSALMALLQEISNTYEKMHLDSAYYIPTEAHEIIKKGDNQWNN